MSGSNGKASSVMSKLGRPCHEAKGVFLLSRGQEVSKEVMWHKFTSGTRT